MRRHCTGLSQRLLIAAAVLGTAGAPAAAADGTTVGVLARRGVSAASGKTSLGAGAGAIEAGLLGSEAFQRAGAIIAGVVNDKAAGRNVAVLAHDEKLDLIMPRLIDDRIREVDRYVATSCARLPRPSAPARRPLIFGLLDKLMSPEGKPLKLGPADIAGVAQVDTTIGAIALTADDRMLVNALMMQRGQGPLPAEIGWTTWTGGTAVGRTAIYHVPTDTMGLPAGSQVYRDYARLVRTVTEWRTRCTGDAGKAIIGTGDGLIASLNASDKGPAPLATAIQLETLGDDPLVLRLAIEQVGGTSLTRAGVIYSFGWPDAATVGSGLLASFRLIDPRTGTNRAVGLIRCMVRQTNVKRVADTLAHPPARSASARSYPPGETVCDYRVSAI